MGFFDLLLLKLQGFSVARGGCQCISPGKEHKLLNLGSLAALTVPKLTQMMHQPWKVLAMEGLGRGRPPHHVAGQGHASCLFPSLPVPRLAPARSFAAGALHAGSMKICFRDEITGLSSTGRHRGGRFPSLGEGCSRRAAPQEVSNAGENLQLDWDALGDEHSNLFHIYYGQQFDEGRI